MAASNEQLRRRYLAAMGIEVWERRSGGGLVPAPDQPPDAAPAPEMPGSELSGLGWEELQGRVVDCTGCALHGTRTQTVFGVGDRQAQLMLVGEAPGAEEDRQGEPFVGRAGRLLDEMLAAIGLRREQVYIANTLKCRPPQNRDPQAGEAAACAGFLARQIELLQPALIVALGRIAAQNLLQTQANMARLRGHLHRLEPHGVRVLVTYHPAYLLRTPGDKRKAWQDFRRARAVLQQGESG